jgi:hypothetical protein
MRFGGRWRALFVLLAFACFPAFGRNAADEPKPTPENTISIHLEEPVPTQKFEHPSKFWIANPAAETPALAGYHVKYAGTRRKDGKIDAEMVELGPPAPPEAYKIPHDLEVVRGKDAQTAIDVLEFRSGKKVVGRRKLLAERSVQEYVSRLGDSLIPEGAKGTRRPIEFRFFVVEDPEINAASLPDGTLMINTGLLGAIENEAQLAFVLSHEMAHVLQVHYRREVEETRKSRIGLMIAGIAAGAFIGDSGLFMAQVGIASVVNGHQRELEDQADRLALQNVIEHARGKGQIFHAS